MTEEAVQRQGALGRARLVRLVAMGAVAVWLLTGVYAVRTDEHVVVRRLGKALDAPVGSGLHIAFPWPIDRRTRLRMEQPRRVTIGFTPADQSVGTSPQPSLARFLTGDENVVQVQTVVQYKVAPGGAVAFLCRARDVRKVVGTQAERAMASVLAGVEVDDILAGEKAAIAEEVRKRTQATLDALDMGVAVMAISIPTVEPPAEVARDFQDVASAREDYHRIINEAEAYAAETVPQAEGRAARLLAEAEGYKLKVTNEAEGDASYFSQLHEQYAHAKEVTSTRLYIETMERLLPNMRVIVADEGDEGALQLGIVRNEP